MNNFTKELERSVIEVQSLIKEKKITHPAVSRLISAIIKYDYINDQIISEHEIDTGHQLYKLSLYEKLFPNAKFLITDSEISIINAIHSIDIILTTKC